MCDGGEECAESGDGGGMVEIDEGGRRREEDDESRGIEVRSWRCDVGSVW